MRIRAKYCGATRPVEIANDQCTLFELHQKTAEAFQFGQFDASSFSLSLNRCDTLTGDSKTLAELGIVPGDLLFILIPEPLQLPPENDTNNSANETGPNQPDSSSSGIPTSYAVQQGNDIVRGSAASFCGAVLPGEHGSSNGLVSENNDFEHPSLDPAAGSTSAASSVQTLLTLPQEFEDSDGENNAQIPLDTEDPEVNRCLREPLLCRESTATLVPAMLRDLYASASCNTATDALWVVIHAVMMEVGFRPVQNMGLSLDESWNRKGFYKQEYRHLFVSAPHICSIVGVPMGSVLVVHGTANVDPPLQTHGEQVKVSNFCEGPINDKDVCQVYKNLDKLSDAIKDYVCQPLLAHLSDVYGFPVSLGLLPLSFELKLKFLSYLPARSLLKMAQVCREYSVVCKDPYLWRRLFLKDFGSHGDNSLNKDWYKLYKEEYLRRKEQRCAPRHRQMFTGIPPWLNPPPGLFMPPLLYTGGIIGGDYDMNPDFMSNIPHPLLGRRPTGMTPGPLTPRPRFADPFGHEALGLSNGGGFGPGGIGPGSGMPGSHFSALRGGPMQHTRHSAFSSLRGRRF